MEETIKAFSGRIIGYIRTESNGDKTVMDFSRHILGYYRRSSNTITTFSGHILAYGDIPGYFFKDLL